MPTGFLMGPLYRFYFKHILPRIGQLLARNSQSAYNYLPESVSQFPQGNELTAMMEECGLTNVRWKSLTFGVAAIYVGEKPQRQAPETIVSEPATVHAAG
jgi:demethylmenaquinone methyltransferase/2-methoxy-6-polyprenyl-1,4-benzoquinol methylase